MRLPRLDCRSENSKPCLIHHCIAGLTWHLSFAMFGLFMLVWQFLRRNKTVFRLRCFWVRAVFLCLYWCGISFFSSTWCIEQQVNVATMLRIPKNSRNQKSPTNSTNKKQKLRRKTACVFNLQVFCGLLRLCALFPLAMPRSQLGFRGRCCSVRPTPAS